MKNEKYFDMAELLPHKPPMILIDRATSYEIENMSLSAEFDVTEVAMFFDSALGGVPAWAGLEYMAQATAAISGIKRLEAGQGAPKIGFILGTRKYTNSIDVFKAGETYKVEVRELFSDNSLGSFSCSIIGPMGNVCAQADVNFFSPENLEFFLT